MVSIAVLLSLGRHPASGRARRAPLDASALELALRVPGAEIHAIHAGDPDASALRDYLGMGLERLAVLAVARDHDPVPALIARLTSIEPDLVLAGRCAEGGEDSGMVPYLVAHALSHAVVADTSDFQLDEGAARVTQALGRGRRRLVTARLPCTLLVGPAAPRARQYAFAAARRGSIEALPVCSSAVDTTLRDCDLQAWRVRASRSPLPSAGNALDRMKALTETKTGAGNLLIDPAPEEAARAIYSYLADKRFFRPRCPGADEPPAS